MASELTVRTKRGIFAADQSVSVGGTLEELHVTSVSGIFDPEESQAYFWSEEWQKGEREADEDIRLGRVTSFDNVDDALRWLREPE